MTGAVRHTKLRGPLGDKHRKRRPIHARRTPHALVVEHCRPVLAAVAALGCPHVLDTELRRVQVPGGVAEDVILHMICRGFTVAVQEVAT